MDDPHVLVEVDHKSVKLYGDRMVIVFDLEGVTFLSDNERMFVLARV